MRQGGKKARQSEHWRVKKGRNKAESVDGSRGN